MITKRVSSHGYIALRKKIEKKRKTQNCTYKETNQPLGFFLQDIHSYHYSLQMARIFNSKVFFQFRYSQLGNDSHIIITSLPKTVDVVGQTQRNEPGIIRRNDNRILPILPSNPFRINSNLKGKESLQCQLTKENESSHVSSA